MVLFADRHRFLWRRRAPLGPDDARRVERWLALARVFLAISALVAIWLDPSELSSRSSVPYWLLRIYITHSVVVMLLLRAHLPPLKINWLSREVSLGFILLVHAADGVWPAVISIYAPGQRSPFFLFFIFVLLAAAYRWGLWETLGTAMGAVTLLWGEGLLLHKGFQPLGAVVGDFSPRRLFMRSILLLVTGLFLGYLAEQQKQLRAEKIVIASIAGKARVELGLNRTLQGILQEMASTLGAKQAILASQEANSIRVFVGVLSLLDGEGAVKWVDPGSRDRELYLSDAPGHAFYATKKGASFSLLALDEEGAVIGHVRSHFVDQLSQRYSFRSLASVAFSLGREWWGRIFLLDPQLSGDRPEALRFLQEMVRQVGPAVYNVFLLRRLRLRAGAVERARVARELHDGAVQSLIAMEMQVDVARRHSAADPRQIQAELRRIQGLLREEVLKLRELMQQMKSIDVNGRTLAGFVHDTVERFHRETGITARSVLDPALDEISPRVCREVVRIIQEALVNVRKHSQARQVMVRLFSTGDHWRLTIEDDGRGFDFAGRLSHAELDSARKGPVVIKERVRLIDGELTIESNPGQGSRLEITAPHQREAAYG